jgi:hypothetical protein
MGHIVVQGGGGRSDRLASAEHACIAAATCATTYRRSTRWANGASGQPARDDRCKAGCGCGQARPILLGDRVLLGYGPVEGRIAWHGSPGERIEELRRVDFAPQSAVPWGRD